MTVLASGDKKKSRYRRNVVVVVVVVELNVCGQTASVVISNACQLLQADVPSVYYFGAQQLQSPVDLTSVQRRLITTMRVQECSTLLGVLSHPRAAPCLPRVLTRV